jgi:chaperone BCS1
MGNLLSVVSFVRLADLQRNDYFRAGVGLLLVNMTYQVAKVLLTSAWTRFQYMWMVSVEISSRDHAHSWILEWLHEQPCTKKSRRLALETTYDKTEDGDSKPRLIFFPSIGNHLLCYKGRWVWLQRTRDESTADFATGSAQETMTLTTFGRDRQLIRELITEAMSFVLKKEEGKTVVYTPMNGTWVKFGAPRASRPLNSVVLNAGVAENILDDILKFFSSAQWYLSRGIAYKRGYLLYGPPGCGKTSFVMAIAGTLNMSICMVNLNNRDLDDTQLSALLNNTPHRKCLILIEDVDAAMSSQEKPLGNGVTLSGLLNVLDGVISPTEGRIIFMTTNHYDTLHPALVRPGRVDVKIHLSLATRYQAEKLFLNFFPNETQYAKQFAAKIPENKYSMAQLQAYLMHFRNATALEAVQSSEHILQIISDDGICNHRILTIDTNNDKK